ncbi:MAG: hypothetical protein HZC17_00195, partial [Candidatus Omnitrophica bacterium]|nr:hypothetical protein [Candidatus Omnitrophota bacterium]
MRNLIDGRGKVGGDQIQRTDNILGAPRKSAPDHRRLSGRSLGQEDGLDNDPPYRDLLQQWYPASSQSRETNAPANCFAFLRKYDEKGEPIFAGVKLSSSNKCTVSVDVFTVDRKAERKNILTQYNCKFSSHPLGFYASEFLVSGIDRLFIDGNQLVIVAVATIHEFVTAGQRGLPSYVKTSELLMPKLVDINELLPKVAGAKAESLGEKVSKKKMDYSKIPFVRISGDEIKFFHQSVKSWLFPDSDMPPSDSLAGQLLRLLTPADRRGFGIPIGMYYWFDRKNAPAHQLSEYGFFFKKGVVIRVSLIMDKHKGTQLEKSERIRLDSYQGEDAEILKNVWRKFSSNASSLGEEEKVSQPVPAVAPVPYDPIKELMKGYEQEPVSIKRTDNIHGAPRKDVLAPGTRENPLKRKSSASGMRNLIDGRGKVGGD